VSQWEEINNSSAIEMNVDAAAGFNGWETLN
jgi:hypothetical protein